MGDAAHDAPEVDFEEVIIENAAGEVVGERGTDGAEPEPLETVEVPSTVRVTVGIHYKDTPVSVAADAKLITEQTLIAVNGRCGLRLPGGWTVASLIFDGVLVEHREGHDLRSALYAVVRQDLADAWPDVRLEIKPLHDEQRARQPGVWPIESVCKARAALARPVPT